MESDDEKLVQGRKLVDREQRHLVFISLAAALSLLGVAGSSLMFVNMISKTMAGRASDTTQQAVQEQNAKAEKLIFYERLKTARYLDPRRMDDHFFSSFYNTNLGITALDLADSRITDKGMAVLPVQKDLHFLSLDNAPVSDSGIAYLRLLHNLLELHLDGTALTDKGMTYIAEIKTLKNLSVRGTAITDQGVNAISGLGLRSLFLSGTPVTDASLKTLSSVKPLQRLSLRSCMAVTGSGLKYLVDLPTLQYLDVENCVLNPAGIAAIGQFKHLIALEFGHTGVTTSGIKALSQIDALEYLNLNGTHVIPEWIPILGKLPRLRSLVLNAGTVDRQALALMPRYMPNLTQLQFRYTSLTDDMIAPLAELKDLQLLDMERSGVSKGAAERLRRLLTRPGHVVQIRY